jgi:DNA-directed RNA polymerase II subunit RPB2
MDDETLWKIIHSHFEENPQYLVSHHLESYDDFFENGIFNIFREKNPIELYSKYDESIQDYRHKCILYMGGKDGTKIYFGKPVIYDKGNSHYMYPNEARLRNMSYSMTVHYDIDVEFIDTLEPGQQPTVIGPEYLPSGERAELDEEGPKVYLEEIEAESKAKEGNFKAKKTVRIEMPKGGDNGEKTTGQFEYEEGMEGGAKDAPQQRKKRAPKPYKMTTNLAALLREANEKSLVAPNVQRRTITLDKIYLGRFPIMVQSKFCILNGLSREARFSLGECRNDPGGYFIIGGKEKTVIAQEKFADNMLYIKKGKAATDTAPGDTFLYSAEIRSVSENASKPVRKFSVHMVAPTPRFHFGNIEVNIPNVQKPIPLFIVFRAVGIISDYDIIATCLLDMKKYGFMIDAFEPCVYDAGVIFTQDTAIKYIKGFTKYSNDAYVQEILNDYFLPHIGENNYIEKAYYLGHIVFRLLSVYMGLELPTDRDNFKYKRIEQIGPLLYSLFQEYYTIQLKKVHYEFESRLYYKQALYADNLFDLIHQNYRDVFRNRIVDDGFKKAFKGNWGAETHTKRIGIIQDLNRLSFHSVISHLRKTNLPLPAGVKLVGPRVLHSSQWGFIDPVDTPDGGNIGLHKQLAITTYISRGYSREKMVEWLREKVGMKPLEECSPILLSSMTKVIVNGYWAGSVTSPLETIEKIRLFRRNALIPVHTSATFEIRQNTIYIYTDAGRLCRPIFYKDEYTGKMSFETSKEMADRLHDGDFTWTELVSGFNKKRESANFHTNTPRFFQLHELYTGVESETNPAKLARFLKDKAVVEYIDASETENALISFDQNDWRKHPQKHKLYTHMEIHGSFLLGVAGNHIIFAENNPLPRDLFSCGQSRQACSVYHTNHSLRMDKTSVVLNYGQIPFVKSRYMRHVDHEENPYGENAIVAIMCYTGYNVEDAVLINEGSLKRGLFRTTYYTTYETHEEETKSGDVNVDKRFSNIESLPNVVGLKPGYKYDALDAYGLIRENTPIDDKTVLIGLTSNSSKTVISDKQHEIRVDMSKTPKKGQLGYVDKAFITEGEEGERIAKVRIREERIPNLGDKFASRSGQKGTVGMIIPEKDMPFTKDGVRPDIIVNPHAIPTRMTIGQLVECITGKASAMYGAFADCTALNNAGSKIGVYGELLNKVGFHSSGNEILYNGMTGEQIESHIFIGPNYYMRLKHMVKDKVNYRARGPRTALTRQPVSGRANDGGLRIGEMERDVLISHGIANFLTESMVDRGDQCYLAICNLSGMTAIYNPDKNLFMSPMADGPIQFSTSVDGNTIAIDHITRFGRDFSIVSIPYTLKLLIQELQTINVQLRIITEDNISQIESMSYSNNIQKLTLIPDATPGKIIESIRDKIKANDAQRIPTTPESPPTPDFAPPGYLQPHSPDFPTTGYIPYAEGSPAYVPRSPDFPTTGYIPYAEGSPAYVPNSPDVPQSGYDNIPYAEGSPAYMPPGSPIDYSAYASNSSSPAYEPSANTKTQNESLKYSPPQPPTMWETVTKAVSQLSPFSKGGGKREPVYYRGSAEMGLLPNHKWYIKRGGDKFVTIETANIDGSFPANYESMMVVHPNDLIRCSDVPSEREFFGEYLQPSGAHTPSHAHPIANPTVGAPSPIQFNPVIKIVNGDDNSRNQGEQKPTTTHSDFDETTYTESSKPIVFKKDGGSSHSENTQTPASNSSSGGFLDGVKNFFIKKIG